VSSTRTPLQQAAAAIRDAKHVALVCHVNPDGDALGSMLGLFHVLRAAGTPSMSSFPSPFIVAPHYRELPGLDLITPPDEFPRSPTWWSRSTQVRSAVSATSSPRRRQRASSS
jgi:phosphoesterase RecJ-like protein